MKISATLFLVSIGSASAFVTAPVVAPETRCSPLRMSKSRNDGWGGVDVEVKNLAPKKYKNAPAAATPGNNNAPSIPKPPQMSKSIPFMDRPAALDGSMAGDVGFDPLGLSKSKSDLNLYREAEIKHARLAMLAAAGWPLSELFDRKIAGLFGMTPVLDATNRAPSVLNGGMGKISPFYWGFCLVLAAAVDVYGLAVASSKKGYFPGDLGFDPLGLYPKDEAGQKRMQTAEIKNGRLAMIAITAFVAQEYVSEIAVVDQTPIFFKPITEILANYGTNAGYYVPPEIVDTPILDAAVTASVEAATDAVSAASAEASAVVASPVDAVSSSAASVDSAAVASTVDAVSAASVESTATVAPVVDAVPPTASVEAVSGATTPPVDDAELVAAKKRIVELEEKLAAIGDLTR